MQFAVCADISRVHAQATLETVHHAGAQRVKSPERMVRPLGKTAVGRAGDQTFGPRTKLDGLRARIDLRRLRRPRDIGHHDKSVHYAKLKSSPEYATAFQEALQIGCDALSDIAVTRAADGWEEPVVYQGRVVLQENSATGEMVPVTVRKIDNQLLMFVLRNRHPDYRERLEHSGKVSGTVKIEASPKAVLLGQLCSTQQLQEMRAKLVAMKKTRSE